MNSFSLMPSITTHNKHGSTWREKIGEIAPLDLSQVGLFVTGLIKAERKECYRLMLEVKEHHEFVVPFVHAVSDMDDAEYAFLRHEFGTRWFNLHPLREFPLIKPLSDETRSFITIENSGFGSLSREDLDSFAGLCIDLSHLEDARLTAPLAFQSILDLCAEFPVRANHISAIVRPASKIRDGLPQYSTHHLASEREMDYVKSLPREVIGEVAALELENSLREQIQVLKAVHQSLLLAQQSVRKMAA
jgi:hypothetical protein